MTYKIKNITIVFAFAAMMLAMPLAIPNAQAETVDANLGGVCGFTTTALESADFGTFTRLQSEDTTDFEEAITLTAGASNTMSARVLVTVADWFTTGTGATGTAEFLLQPEVDDELVVGAKTYLAKAGGAAGDQYNIGANIVETALNAATAIRASDSANYRLSTAGTATISFETVAKNDNNDVLSEDTGGVRIETKDSTASTVNNILSGAVSTPVLIIDGENTKFAFSSASSPSGAYSAKVATVTLGTAQEVLGGTVPANAVFMTIEIDPDSATYNAAALPYVGPITQLITVSVESACDGT